MEGFTIEFLSRYGVIQKFNPYMVELGGLSRHIPRRVRIVWTRVTKRVKLLALVDELVIQVA